MISVLVVSFNTKDLIDKMMGALQFAMHDHEFEVIFVDNASKDGSAEFIEARYPQHRLIKNNVNIGFGRANNLAVEFAKGDFILLLNTDAFVSSDTIEKSMTFMAAHPKCGILGVKLVGRDKELQPSCRYFPTPLRLFVAAAGLTRFSPPNMRMDDLDWGHDRNRECDWVPGCYYLMRRDVYQSVGLFDPRYFLYYEEVDHCRQAKNAGWKVYFCPDTTVVHIGGESAKTHSALTHSGRQISALQVESELLYLRKFHGIMGIILHALLHTACNFIILAKAVLKCRIHTVTRDIVADTSLRWKLIYRTRFCRAPTR